MDTIDERQVRRIAELARLEPGAEEIGRLRRELGSILRWFAALDELPLDDVEPTAGAAAAARPPRADEPRPPLGSGAALAGAPDAAEGHFRVPRVIEAEAAPDSETSGR